MESIDRPTSRLVADARAIASHWLDELDLSRLTSDLLERTGLREATVDVVAIGKAAPEMTSAVEAALAKRVRRRLVVCDDEGARRAGGDNVVVGEHPVPGEGSLGAGAAVLDFLDGSSEAEATLFLVSGGASSLCVVPAPPLTLGDLASVWEATLRAGVEITTLNMVRAAGSLVAGGALLRHVRTPTSRSFILVDNVVSGAPWVASAMTYDYRPTTGEARALWARAGITDPRLLERLALGLVARESVMAKASATNHENYVLAEPSMMLGLAMAQARRLGYGVIDMGAAVAGDVRDVAIEWSGAIAEAPSGPVALVGVGEVTVKVSGRGEGGRCQEFAWLMADALARSPRDGAFVAQASDGCDHLRGIAGAWVDGSTQREARARGIDWRRVAERHDTYPALNALGHLIEGSHTGWNLCDLYVAVLEEGYSRSRAL